MPSVTRRNPNWMRCLGLIGVTALTSFLMLRPPSTSAEDFPFKPVQAMTIVQAELSGRMDDPNKLEVHTLFAVREDGAEVNKTLTTGRNHSGLEAWNITLPAVRTYTVVVDRIRAQSTMYLAPDSVKDAGKIKIRPKCNRPGENATLQGEGEISGFHVYVYSKGEINPSGFFVKTREWRAERCDCRTVKLEQTTSSQDGKVVHTFDREPLSITLGSPDPQLFEIPASYREMPPSQANRELIEFKTKKAFGSDPAHKRLEKGLERMDAEYWASQRYQ